SPHFLPQLGLAVRPATRAPAQSPWPRARPTAGSRSQMPLEPARDGVVAHPTPVRYLPIREGRPVDHDGATEGAGYAVRALHPSTERAARRAVERPRQELR